MAKDSPIDVGMAVKGGMDAASKALKKASRDAIREAGKIARAELMKTAVVVPGPDRGFSRMGGRKLSVRFESAPGQVEVIPKGPWKIPETGAAPHRGKAWNHAFRHPGTAATQGRRSWSKGRDAAFDVIGVQVLDDIGEAVEQAFERS